MIHASYKISAIVVTLAILSAANLHGQDTSLEMTSAENQLISDTLSNCIGNYFDQLSQAQTQEFKDGKKKEWLKYMPSVGLTYTPAGEPRPGVTLSSSLIYTAHKDKQARLSRIKSIQLTNKLNAETEILAFKNLVQELEIMKLDLEHDKKTLEIDTELFDFYTKQYETQKLSPSQYLLKKKDYQNKKERIRKADMMIQIHLLKINQASRCNN